MQLTLTVTKDLIQYKHQHEKQGFNNRSVIQSNSQILTPWVDVVFVETRLNLQVRILTPEPQQSDPAVSS